MAYCTQQDILDSGISSEELAQLTSDEDGVIDGATVTRAITASDEEINGYVAVKYNVPLNPVPSMIKSISITIAKYKLFEGRAHRLGGINEAVKDAYKRATDVLKDISKGLISLGVDPPPTKSTTTGGSFKGDERQFTKDNLKGM